MTQANNDLSVLIIGAGPTGLMLACELLRRGVQCRIVDKLEIPSDKSRALALHARTLEIFENMGIVDKFLGAGNEAHGFSLYAGQKRIVHVSTTELESPYPIILMMPQEKIEKLLTEHLQSLGGKIERGIEIANFSQDNDGVKATLKHTDGREEVVAAQYLVGCDGAHSYVRKALQLPFEGDAYEERFALGDVHVECSLPEDEVSTFFHQDGALVFFPMGNKRFRMMGNIDETKVIGDEPTIQFIQSLSDERTASTFKIHDAVWLAWFRIHRRSVPKYRVGRVFVAGDAAHIHSPVGGQGMNTGMQDVHNLAWKLALVVKGHAQDALLDTYDSERHPIGQELLKGTDMATKMAFLRNPIAKQIRNNVMGFLSQQEVVVQRLRKVGTMMAVNYRSSSLVGEYRDMRDVQIAPSGENENPTLPSWIEFARAPLPGDHAPDVVLADAEGNPSRLYEGFQNNAHNLLLFDGKPTAEGYDHLVKLAISISEKFCGLVVPHLIIAGNEIPKGLNFPGKIYLDMDLAAHQTYGTSTESQYLIPPDGYIGFRSQPAKLAPLEEHLGKILNKAKVAVS